MNWSRGRFRVNVNADRRILRACDGADVCSAKGG